MAATGSDEKLSPPPEEGGPKEKKKKGGWRFDICSSILNELRKSKHSVSVFVMSGIKLTNLKIVAFDEYGILFLKENGERMLVFRSAIASIDVGSEVPVR